MSQPPPPEPPHHSSGPQHFPSGPRHSPFGPPAPPEGLSTGAKVALGGASAGTALLVLLLIGYFVWVRPGDSAVVAEPPVSPSDGTAAAPDGTSAPEEPRDPSEDSPEDEPEDGPQDPGTPPDFPEYDVQEFSGTGTTTVEIETREEPGILTMSHEGNGRFFVWAVDSETDTSRAVVRRGNDYEGSVLFNTRSMFETIVALEVVTEGAWEISLEPLSAATHWEATDGEYEGDGDEVVQLLWSPTNFATLDVTHNGLSNFIVTSRDDLGSSSHINEIGRYEGEVTLSSKTLLVAVEADGSWAITR